MGANKMCTFFYREVRDTDQQGTFARVEGKSKETDQVRGNKVFGCSRVREGVRVVSTNLCTKEITTMRGHNRVRWVRG